jgi:transposase InsO family protein
MPWRETHVPEQRVLLIAEYLRGERSLTDIADHFGVSRKTAYRWIDRFESGGLLEELSRRPRSSPLQTSSTTVEIIVATRRAHPTWGPRKLLAYLSRLPEHQSVAWPAASTAGDILKRQGLVEPRRRRRRLVGERRACVTANAPNDSWSIDLKGHFRLGDGRRCDPLTITDNFSRYLLRCVAVDEPKLGFIQPVIESAFREYGLPSSMRSDNGPPFGSSGVGGLSRLAVWLIKLGVRPDFITPAKPQQNGRHERMHRTLKAEACRPPRKDQTTQQGAFDVFVDEYNNIRPHESLANETPASAHRASTRQMPTTVPSPTYPSPFTIRMVKGDGDIKWRNERLYLSEVLAHEPVGLEEVGDDIWHIHFGIVPIVILDGFTRKLYPMGTAIDVVEAAREKRSGTQATSDLSRRLR